jgi:cytochrome P450
MPAFSFRHIKDLYPAFWSKAGELTKCLEKEVDANKSTGTNVIEVRRWATRTTLDIIGLAGMDHDFESLRDPNNLVSQQYQQMRRDPSRLEIVIILVLSLFSTQAARIVSRLPTKRMKQVQEASLYSRTLCRNIIQEKQDKQKIASTKNDVDLIAVALKCAVFTDENLVDQMMTFLAAGHGTTSHDLQWAVYALCKHNHIQTRLRQEIRDKLPSIGDLESTVSATDIDSLAYLNAF